MSARIQPQPDEARLPALHDGDAVHERTEFTWAELDEAAKAKAVEHYQYSDVEDYGWWENVYNDAVTIAGLLGIDIDNRRQGTQFTRHEPDIRFELHVQGAGASYQGTWVGKFDAVEAVKAYAPEDEELHRIAGELVRFLVVQRLQYGATASARITNSTRYVYSSAMDFVWGADFSDEDGPLLEAAQQALRDFADWIYTQLEAEHDYLTSEEHAREWLSQGDYQFDEDGRII